MNENEGNSWNDRPKSPRSGGLFKSPFPLQPGTLPGRTRQERPAYEDDLTEAAEPEAFLPAPFQDDDPSDVPDARRLRRSASRPPANPAAFDEEDLEGLPSPPYRSGRNEGDQQRPASRSRRAKDAAFAAPPGQTAIPAHGKRPRRVLSMVLKTSLAVVLLVACSGVSFALAEAYHFYTFAQSVTGKSFNVGTAKNGVQPTPLPDDLAGIKHFNLLLLGSDNDAKFPSGAVLTQTDIVVRIDLENHTITMVSFPRDLWIPNDYGSCCAKLDEISGNETNGPSGDTKLNGFAHTAATIETDFGIPINAFAWVGLAGFVKVIDTLGGVDVDVLHPIVDDAYPNDVNNADPYSYKRLYIPAGPQHLDGQTALEYVRSRHSDLTGDFGRSARQQSVLVALKKKLDDPTIFTKLGDFANDLQGSVLTSLTLNQVLNLARFARGVASKSITQVVLSPPTYGSLGQTHGKSVVFPNLTAIDQAVEQYFPESNVSSVNFTLSQSDKQTIQSEGAHILIENGSGVPGVPAKLETILKNEGFTVVGVQNAQETNLSAHIEVFNLSKTSGTAKILEGMFGVPFQAASSPPQTGVDIVIIIGTNTANAIQQA